MMPVLDEMCRVRWASAPLSDDVMVSIQRATASAPRRRCLGGTVPPPRAVSSGSNSQARECTARQPFNSVCACRSCQAVSCRVRSVDKQHAQHATMPKLPRGSSLAHWADHVTRPSLAPSWLVTAVGRSGSRAVARCALHACSCRTPR